MFVNVVNPSGNKSCSHMARERLKRLPLVWGFHFRLYNPGRLSQSVCRVANFISDFLSNAAKFLFSCSASHEHWTARQLSDKKFKFSYRKKCGARISMCSRRLQFAPHSSWILSNKYSSEHLWRNTMTWILQVVFTSGVASCWGVAYRPGRIEQIS